IEIPKILYKYRDWNNNKHKRIITKQEVFYPSPTSFEDKYDCKIPIRYDLLTHNEILNRFFELSKLENRNLSSYEHMQIAIENTATFDANASNEKDLKRLHSQLGVLCLTTNPCNVHMWNEYANNHSGFCIGFAGTLLHGALKTRCDKVNYYNDLPIILPSFKQTFKQQESLQVYSKLKKWEQEEEYRSFDFSYNPLKDSQRTKKVPDFVYKEIIFGAKMPNEVIKKIIKILLKKFEVISLKRAIVDGSDIQIIPYEFGSW
ncbi:DUF2971 domain-containing protein, partial [bacterium]